MTLKVDFYLLKYANFTACLRFACQLIHKAYQQEHQLKIACEEASQQMELDQLLWQFQAQSFIPHHTVTEDSGLWIMVGPHTLTPTQTRLQINLQLTAAQPTTLSTGQRLLQIVPNDPTLLQIARAHYRYYKEQNYTLTTHTIT